MTLACVAAATACIQAQTEHNTAERPPAPSLQECIRTAEENSDVLRQAFENWQSALHEIALAGALPDPVVSYTYYLDEVETRLGPQEHRLSIMQALPWPARLDAQTQSAVHRAEARRFALENARRLLRFRVSKAFHEYAYLGRAVELVDADVHLVDDLAETLRASYVTTGTPVTKLLSLQVEMGRLIDQRDMLKAQEPALAAQLNTEMGRDPETPVQIPGLPEPAARIGMSLQQLRHALQTANPDLRAWREAVRSQEAAVDVARASARPDLGVGASYVVTGDRTDMQPDDNGADAVMLTVQLSLPIWTHKNRARLQQALAQKRRAEAEADETARRLVAQLIAAYQEVTDAERRSDLYASTLIPQAQQALDTIKDGFVTGTTSFADLTDARRKLLDLQLQHQRAIADRLNGAARITALTADDTLTATTQNDTKETQP